MKIHLSVLLGLIAAILFGLTPAFCKNALTEVSVFELLCYRYLVAFIVVFILVLFKKIKFEINKTIFIDLFLKLSLINPVISLAFEVFGTQQTSVSITGAFLAIVPLATAIFGYVLIKERFSILSGVFMIFTIIGCVLLSINSSFNIHSSIIGILSLIIDVFTLGYWYVIVRKYRTKYSSELINTYMIISGTFFFTSGAIFEKIIYGGTFVLTSPLKHLSLLTNVLYLGIFGTVIGFLFLAKTMKNLKAITTSIIMSFSPLITICVGIFFFKENISFIQKLGIYVVFIGVLGFIITDSKKDLTNKNNISKFKEESKDLVA